MGCEIGKANPIQELTGLPATISPRQIAVPARRETRGRSACVERLAAGRRIAAHHAEQRHGRSAQIPAGGCDRRGNALPVPSTASARVDPPRIGLVRGERTGFLARKAAPPLHFLSTFTMRFTAARESASPSIFYGQASPPASLTEIASAYCAAHPKKNSPNR